MANRINFQIGYNVDRSGLNEIKSSLEAISKMTSKDLMNINRSLGITEAREQMDQIRSSVSKIGDALSRSFNTDLGTLNVAKFNEEIRNLGTDGLNKIYRDFNALGPAGQSAFRQITAQALTTNMQLKQTHSLMDNIAKTMANTIKWELSSSVMKNFTGSIEKAYGYVKNLDRSLNDIRIVTGNSAEQMADFAVQANKVAQSLGTGTTDFTDAALIYYQQGRHDT